MNIVKPLRLLVITFSMLLCVTLARADEYFSYAQGQGTINVDETIYGDFTIFDVGSITSVSLPLLAGDLSFSGGWIAAVFLTVDTNQSTGTYMVGYLPNGEAVYITLY